MQDGSPPDNSPRIFSPPASALGYDNMFFPSGLLAIGVAAAAAAMAAERMAEWRKRRREGESLFGYSSTY